MFSSLICILIEEKKRRVTLHANSPPPFFFLHAKEDSISAPSQSYSLQCVVCVSDPLFGPDELMRGNIYQGSISCRLRKKYTPSQPFFHWIGAKAEMFHPSPNQPRCTYCNNAGYAKQIYSTLRL